MNRDINPSDNLKKISLYSFIAFLSISALFAIASVFTGTLGEFELKILTTTSVIAIASICSLCCSAYSSRIHNNIPSYSGISLAGASAAMLILGVWEEINSEAYWKTTAILSVFAFAFAHALALLAVRLKAEHAWVQFVAAINIFTFATVISASIVGEFNNEETIKFTIALAILAALETLVIPILGRLAKGSSAQVREVLSLTKRVDGTYEDNHGHPIMCRPPEQELAALHSCKVEATLQAFESIDLDPRDIHLIAIAHDVAHLAVKEAINGCNGKGDHNCS